MLSLIRDISLRFVYLCVIIHLLELITPRCREKEKELLSPSSLTSYELRLCIQRLQSPHLRDIVIPNWTF